MGNMADAQQAPENFGGSASGVMSPGGAGMVRRNLSPHQFRFGSDNFGGTAYGGGELQPSLMTGVY